MRTALGWRLLSTFHRMKYEPEKKPVSIIYANLVGYMHDYIGLF